MCFGLTKPKCNFLATTKEGIFWRKKGEAFVENNTLITVKHGGGSVLWGCVAARGTENIVLVEGRMDSTKYSEIVEANGRRPVQTLKLKQGWVFHQYNDHKHTSKSTMKYHQERQALEWPPQSPDLNIIEHSQERSQTCRTCKKPKEHLWARAVLPGRMGEAFQKRELKDS